jgi:hypothetical protein
MYSTTANPSIERDWSVDNWNVYAYSCIPAHPDWIKRRFNYQCSHDFGGDGHIQNDRGHIRACLQAIGSDGGVKGLVGCQIAPNSSNTACHIDAGFLAWNGLDASFFSGMFSVKHNFPLTTDILTVTSI